MFKGFNYLLVSFLILLACSKDNNEQPDTPEPDVNVETEDVEGTWYVYGGEFMGNFIQTVPNFPKCGYDYIVFSVSGIYKEVVFENATCIPRIATGTWVLENGVIEVKGAAGERLEFPVIDSSPTELVINFQYDLDNDGEQDLFKAFLRPYNPIDNNHIARSFSRDPNEQTLLKFNWTQESSGSSFSSYEVYRSQEGTCSKKDAVLIAKITDISQTSIIDDDPPPSQGNLCYFLRVYSQGQLVGESELLSVNPKQLVIQGPINLKTPRIEGEDILLEWDAFSMPYFSHYEIVYANTDGSNLLFHEEDLITSIDKMDAISYLDYNPPYLENPFFAIYAYNIYGSHIVSNYEQVTFRRKDLVGPIYLEHIVVDPVEPVVYLYGRSMIPAWTTYDENSVLRFNYNTGLIESTTGEETSFSDRIPFVGPFNFMEGRELVVNRAYSLNFLDPISLTENYSFGPFYLGETFELYRIVDLTFTSNEMLVAIDSDYVYVFQRNGGELTLLDKQIHYTTHHGDENYRLLEINNGDILIGHKSEQESILFSIDANGLLQDKRVVPLPLSSTYISAYKNVSFASDSGSSMINYGAKTLYSTLNFQSLAQLPNNLFALGMDQLGSRIFASVNNPNWYGSDVQTEFLKREVLIYDTGTGQITAVHTKGYPIRVFENNSGEIFSISIPENQNITQFDVFVEKIDVP